MSGLAWFLVGLGVGALLGYFTAALMWAGRD